MNDVLTMLILGSAFLALFGIAELLYHRFKVRVEITRKIVHIVTGLITLTFPVLLNNHWLVLLLCTSFAVILIVSLKFNLLKSINAIERESVGSICYPIAVYGCYLAFVYFHHYTNFYLPILILAICDPIAALVGKRWPLFPYRVGKDKKTLMGSSMFLLSALMLCYFLGVGFERGVDFTFVQVVTIALIATSAEAVSRRGYDNITIPAAVLVTWILTDLVR